MTQSSSTQGGDATFDKSYYDANYRHYERQNPERKMAFYRAAIARHADPSLPRRMHDVGCAFGRFLASVAAGDPAWELYGTDVSEYAVDQARRALPGAHLAVAGATTVPGDFPQMSVVTAFDTIEHVPDLAAVGSALRQELPASGLFLFVVPVYDGLSGPVIKLLDKDPTHVHKWPRRRWLDWIAAEGFEVREWVGILRYLLPGGYYLHVPTSAGRAHTPAILVAARRRA